MDGGAATGRNWNCNIMVADRETVPLNLSTSIDRSIERERERVRERSRERERDREREKERKKEKERRETNLKFHKVIITLSNNFLVFIALGSNIV